MIIDDITILLKQLKLHGMVDALLRHLDSPNGQFDTFEEYLKYLLEAELSDKETRRLHRNFSAAKLREPSACIEKIEHVEERKLNIEELKSLALCYWVKKYQHIIFTGLTGVGKTWLACAFGSHAIRIGFTVLYVRFSQLVEDFALAEASGQLPSLRKKLYSPNVLILDDFGITPINNSIRTHLYNLIEERDGKGSLIITTQMPVNEWYEYIGAASVSETILDRIVHRSHKIELHGESMRKVLHKLGE